MTSTLINYERVGLPAMRAAVGLIVEDNLGCIIERFHPETTRAQVVGRKIVAAIGARPVSDILAIELFLGRLSAAELEVLTCGDGDGAGGVKPPLMVRNFLSAAFEADGLGRGA